MITRLFIVVLGSLLVGCEEKPEEYFGRGYIHTFIHPDSTSFFPPGDSTEPIPPVDSNKRLFVAVDSDRVAFLDKLGLSEIYQRHFPATDFYKFLYDALNQKTVFPARMLPQQYAYIFQLNETISHAYRQTGVNTLLKTYFEKKELAYGLKSHLESDQQYTILYFMFLNGYEIGFNEYEGSFYLYPSKPSKND